MNKLVIFALAPIVFGMSSAYALESGGSYFLDDSEYISVLIDIEQNGTVNFQEVFVIPDDDSQYIMDESTVKTVRISDNGDTGLVFGDTLQGDKMLVKWSVSGDDVSLKAKIWTDDKYRIITNGEVISLF